MYNRLGIWQSPPTASLEPALPPGVNARPSAKETHTHLCIPLEMIPTDLSLPCALFVRIAEKYVLFRSEG